MTDEHAPPPSPLPWLPEVGTLMFDFYGTIVDMQAGLTEAIGPFLRSKGNCGEPSSVVTWWRRTHFENSMIDALLHREHTPYREISRRALAYTLERARIPHTLEEVDGLVAAIERLRPFPDVLAALGRLQNRFALVILSNGDPDMLERGVAHTGFPFDRVISVAAAGSFKPHVATYRKAAELLDAAPSTILFVANHPFDCVGAKAFGMRTAYVNRRRRPFGGWPHQPDLVAASFQDLAERLVG
jgi:2-haloacid dehalogenase